jgi:hypothetical protein
MARRGVISDEAVVAAGRFRSDSQTAALQALRAAQKRERTGPGCLLPQDISFRAERASQRIYEAIDAVGQPGGSCVWAVVGEGALVEGRAQQVRVSAESAAGAAGVLVGALGALEAH